MTKKGLTRINGVISSLYSILFFLFLILSNIAAGTEDTTLQPLEFNRDIRPILAEKCFYCHGPDPNKREADLRLDQRQSALDAGAIDPSESLILERIDSSNSEFLMPPPDSNRHLSPSEKKLFLVGFKKVRHIKHTGRS